MPLFAEKKANPNQQTNQSANQPAATSTSAKPENSAGNKSGLLTIIGQLLPLAPFAFEQFTGQKVPQMSGTIAEMQMALTNIQTNLQVIVQNQQQLVNRISQLETNASQQFTNLIQQVQTVQSLRLTHTREKKEIEYNPPSLETESNY